MFAIKYDKVSMIRLVQCVEKHPAIYDIDTCNYSKEELDSAWVDVAHAVGEKESLCRERWHSIRYSYIRHLKYITLNPARKPYYLAEFLDFLLPHVSERTKTFLTTKNFHPDNLPVYLKEALPKGKSIDYSKIFQTALRNTSISIKDEIVDVEEVSDSEWLSVTQKIPQQPSTSRKKVSKRKLPSKRVTSAKTSKKVKTKEIKKKQTTTIDDNIKFFKTIEPEMARMSHHQKLKFKQEVLSIVEEIFYASVGMEDVNVVD